MRNAGLKEAQAGMKITRRNITNLRYADDTTFIAEIEGLKSLLMKAKEESGKVGLKFIIQKTKIMVSIPTASWQIDGETKESDRDFSFSSLCAIRVVSSAYLRLLVFLLAILTPVCASSSLAFHMVYSAYKLNRQGDILLSQCGNNPFFHIWF